jgi:hypothetical protein
MVAPGVRIAGRFEVERLAGAGGMGSVYRAHDGLGRRRVLQAQAPRVL